MFLTTRLINKVPNKVKNQYSPEFYLERYLQKETLFESNCSDPKSLQILHNVFTIKMIIC